MCGATCSMTLVFTEPTSDTMAPGRSAAFICAATSPQAPTGTHMMTRSAPSAAPRRQVGGGGVGEAEAFHGRAHPLAAIAAHDRLGEVLMFGGASDRRAD